MRGFRTTEACRLTGATFRQADHWSRMGILIPSIPARGSGTQRVYTVRETQAMWAMTQLSRLGIGPGPSLESRARIALALCNAPEFAGWLIANEHQAVIGDRFTLAATLDQLGGSGVVVLDLDRCPVRTKEVVPR